ncbi:MAG: RNA methyltransferase [Chitinispirillaceae bacterium]|nr:RNA methyltransferase [Chitinispirillaceae bacterium]
MRYMAPCVQRGRETLKPLSWYKGLAFPRGRRESGCFIVEGRRSIEQIAQCAASSLEELLISEETPSDPAGVAIPRRVLTAQQFRTVVSSTTPQGVAAVVRIPQQSYSFDLPPHPGKRVLLLEEVQDPGNVGTLIRTAAALGYDGMVLSGECADPFSPKAVQASAGSVMSLWIRRTTGYLELTGQLKDAGFICFASVCDASAAEADQLPFPHLIMLGSEGKGLSSGVRALADKTIAIPIDRSKAQSLNVAVAGAILMYCGLKRNDD